MGPRNPLLALLLVLSLPTPVLGQGTAPILDLDPSIRSAGMAGATGSVHWGGDANYWANPALLGYHRGLRYEYGVTSLVPGLADDVRYRTSRFSAGFGGVGVAIVDKPDGFGYMHLGYGTLDGGELGPYQASEHATLFGVGASLSGILAGAFGAVGENPPMLFRLLDVAAGYAEKDVLVRLAPQFATTTAKDWGVLGRLTIPLVFDDVSGRSPARIEAAFGRSIINYNDDAVLEIGPTPLSTTRTFRTGGSARLAIDMPRRTRRALRGNDLGWLARGLSPLVSVGGAFDREEIQVGADDTGRHDVDRWGVEVTLANIVSMRYGHVRDPLGDIDGSTWGLGLGLDLGFGGFRYDHAEVPQASGLPEVKRRGWTAYVDPVALVTRGR